MAKKVQLQTNGKEWQVIDGVEVYVDVEKQDIDPITSSSCVQIEGFRTLEEAVSDNKMLSQDLTYTKVMDKVGGDYHQNVLDGQYSKAILYGNTQVNLCEEDSSVALQIPTTFTSFNNGELQIKNKESQVVAPLIKGVTMVNLAQINSSSVASGQGVPIQNVKGNTVYTLSFTFSTKNTNSGVVIECYDVNGEYLGNVMHKTGLGDVVKFTFTTHANATKIHICNNAAYGGETIQLDEIMLIEGDQTALDIPYFKGMKSVELVKPLTNLFRDNSFGQTAASYTNNNGTVTVTSTSSSSWANARFYLDWKPQTEYVIMWDSLSYTYTSTNVDDTICICVDHTIVANSMTNPFANKRSIIFNTGDRNVAQINLRIHATTSNTETGTTTVTGLRVFEYDDYLRSVDLQTIGWFSGTKNVAVEPIKTCSKNLYPYGDVNFTSEFADSWCDAKGNAYMISDIALKSQSRFLLKKGIYWLSHDGETNISALQIVDDKENLLYNPITLKQDTYCTVRVKTINANTLTTVSNIQIERGETATDYVTHDSRYYEPDGQNAIVLRSLPNGVCDTFNLQTGEYVQRINEVVFDGSEDENWNAVSETPWTQNGYYVFEYLVQTSGLPTYDDNNGIYAICDKFNSITYSTARTDAVGILLYDLQGRKVGIKQKEYTTLDEWKQYLQQNPLTVQYQLATPITTIIPRTIKRNNNGTVSTVDFKTYTNKENLRLPSNPSYLTINSMTSIKPVVEPITYVDFKTRLKANTDYSVKLNKETNAFVTTNLGGTSVVFNTGDTQKLVKTPSINLEQNLRISGSGIIQNIMVIEGDVLDKELPYFNGMCNVKMPIVRNCGKNFITGKVIKKIPDVVEFEICRLKPNQQYIISSNYNFAQGRVSLGGKNNEFIIQDWTENKKIFKAPSDVYNYNRIRFWKAGLAYDESTMYFQLEEGTQATLYEPYRGNDICIAQGEIGLSQDMFEQGGFSGVVGNTYDNCKATNTSVRTRTKGLISVKPNSTYIINNTTTNLNHVFYFFDEKQTYLGQQTVVNIPSFITPNNCRYMSLMFSKGNNSNILVSDLNVDQFQVLELDSTIQLRSLPNGVKDELNLLTGEYIQRVGEVVLDGSEDEDWQLYTQSIGGSKYFRIGMPVMKTHGDTNTLCTHAICDKLEIVVYYSDIYNMSSRPDSVVSFAHSVILNAQAMFVYQTGNQGDLVQFKQWLQQNPITVQYQLAEPIISYPRIVSNTQEREVGVKLPYGGICDTYNPSTGITVKRVGKAVLDGSEDWLLDTTKTNTQVFRMPAPKDFAPTYNNFITESLPTNDGTRSDTEKIAANQSNHSATSGLIWCLYIALLKTKASTVDELKTYLSSNPITVWYELKNPIVTTDIVLPNGVHDEYNPLTGLYTKRVGYIELDGSDDEIWSPQVVAGNDTHCYASISIDGTVSPQMKHMAIHDEVYIMSNSYETVARSNYSYDKEQMYVWSVRTVYLNILQSRLSTVDITGFKKYLSQNPIKLWFELQNPITYQLTPYFGLPMPYAYKDGYLIMDSAYEGQTLPPEITYQLTVNRTGQITQNNIKLKEHTARLSNLEYMLIEATLDSIFDREMQNFELELMNIELLDLDE